MARGKMTIGPFTFNWDEFCRWLDGPFRDIETEGSDAYNRFCEKFVRMTGERPNLFFDNSMDETTNKTFLEVVTEYQSPVENDDRTKDKPVVKKRWGKFKEADNAYTVVPVAYVEGRDKPQMETFNGRKALYVAIIDGIVEVHNECVDVIPTHYTVKFSKRVITPKELVERIDSHDRVEDALTKAQKSWMKIAQVGHDKYKNHVALTKGNSAVKSWGGFDSPIDVLNDEAVGPLYMCYLDCTIGDSYNFNSLNRAFELLVEEETLTSLPKGGYKQAGFMRGAICRLLQSIEEDQVSLENAVNLFTRKLQVPSDLSLREMSILKELVCLSEKKPTGYKFKSTNAVDRHHELGSKFISMSLSGAS